MVVGQSSNSLYLEAEDVPARFGHIPSLDGLRGVSILLVIFSHFVSKKIPGGLGVYIFFVISGFLISRLLFAEMKMAKHISLKAFYFRRIVRLYPVVVAFTLIVLAVYAFMHLPIDFAEPASALFYFANYHYAQTIGTSGVSTETMPFSIFWSLSIEEHFYLLFPAALLLLRANASRIAALMISVCALCLVLRLAVSAIEPAIVDTNQIYYGTQYRLDSIAFGVLIAAACETAAMRRRLMRLTGIGPFTIATLLIFACLLIRNPLFRETLRYTILGISIALALVAILLNSKLSFIQRVLNATPIVWIGRLSYSLYVWHYLVLRGTEQFGTDLSPPMIFAIQIVLSFGLAAASFYLLEKPLNELRHRLGSRTA